MKIHKLSCLFVGLFLLATSCVFAAQKPFAPKAPPVQVVAVQTAQDEVVPVENIDLLIEKVQFQVTVSDLYQRLVPRQPGTDKPYDRDREWVAYYTARSDTLRQTLLYLKELRKDTYLVTLPPPAVKAP